MKRPIEERNALFHDILNSPDYIMEDAGRFVFAGRNHRMGHGDFVV